MLCQSTNRGICVLAPAKLNLFLHVVGRRQDGYHLLETLNPKEEEGNRISGMDDET